MKMALFTLAAGKASGFAAPADINAFEVFKPVVRSQMYDSLNSKYASRLEIEVTFKGEHHILDLDVNRGLFSSDWSLVTYDSTGAVVRNETDPASFMCHYVGTVQGQDDAMAVASFCDDIGLQGRVHWPSRSLAFTFQRLHGDDHIVFDEMDVFPDEDGIDEEEFADEVIALSVKSELDVDGGTYTNHEALLSDQWRMNEFSSSNAEAQNSQAMVNTGNSYYKATSFGDTIVSKIKSHIQNPPDWGRHTGVIDVKTALQSTKDYFQKKVKNQGATGATGMFGKEKAWSGAVKGRSYGSSMCGGSASSILKLDANDNSKKQAAFWAHELGHRISFNHDDKLDNNCWVMHSSGCKESVAEFKFSSQSIGEWKSNRGKFGCLQNGAALV
jgi:hypothetical protein